MKIIGGHDYYDSALSFGHDPNVVFVRGKEAMHEEEMDRLGFLEADLEGYITIEKEVRRKMGMTGWRRSAELIGADRNLYSLNKITLILGETRYQGIFTHSAGSVKPVPPRHFWNLADFEEWMASLKLQYIAPNYKVFGRYGKPKHTTTLPDYFTPTKLPKSLIDTMIERRWTILLHHPFGRNYTPEGFVPERNEWPWLINPTILKEIQFFKVIPPNIMFQEIEMWVSGVLPNVGKEMLEVSDEVRQAKHGMDKTSFRKPPQR